MKYFLLGYGSAGILFNAVFAFIETLHAFQYVHLGTAITALIVSLILKRND
jgi:hypothetical protein